MNIADSSSHLDYEALADLAEGLLDDERAASAGEHLAGCSQCREREAELADVSRILAEAPMPPMPAELAARIDAALAAERSSPGLPEELHTAISGRRRPRRYQVLSAAAAAVVVLGGGATVAKVMMNSSMSASEGKSEATGPTHAATPPSALKPLAGGNGQSRAMVPNTDAGAARMVIVASGADYKDATLGAQVQAALRQQRTSSQVLSAVGVEECTAAAAPGRVPVLVDVDAHYRGAKVFVIAVRSATPNAFDIVITGPGCTTGHADVVSVTQAVAN